MHTNLVWPYHPLRRDGGGLSADDRRKRRALVEECHRRGLRMVLGLPSFMPVELAKEHPDWRIRASATARLPPPSAKDIDTLRLRQRGVGQLPDGRVVALCRPRTPTTGFGL
jgi:hypothetical protein